MPGFHCLQSLSFDWLRDSWQHKKERKKVKKKMTAKEDWKWICLQWTWDRWSRGDGGEGGNCLVDLSDERRHRNAKYNLQLTFAIDICRRNQVCRGHSWYTRLGIWMCSQDSAKISRQHNRQTDRSTLECEAGEAGWCRAQTVHDKIWLMGSVESRRTAKLSPLPQTQ